MLSERGFTILTSKLCLFPSPRTLRASFLFRDGQPHGEEFLTKGEVVLSETNPGTGTSAN
jgi:hypothetical protein